MAPEKEVKQWPIEDIPNSGQLFMRVHEMWIQSNDVMPGVFRNHGDGMSTDWNKYSTPQETLNRASEHGKDPDRYGVIQMNVGQVRAIPKQSVTHTPLPSNRSHTDVFGEKDSEARLKFSRIYSWVIPYNRR